MEILPAAKAEAIEAEFMYQYEAGLSAREKAALGVTTRRLAGGVALSVRVDPTHYWSKALGFGFDEPVTAELIDQILDTFRSEQNPLAVLQIAPEALPDNWAWICRSRGLTEGGRLAKHVAPIDDVVPVGSSDLRIGPVSKDDADRWATVVADGMGMTGEATHAMFAASVSHPKFFPYAAWDGDTMVGGANLFVHDDIASLNAGAVLASHRRRGAQSALIAARVDMARELGCHWVVSETGKAPEGQSNPSTNNMLRAGAEISYVRRNYIWRNQH